MIKPRPADYYHTVVNLHRDGLTYTEITDAVPITKKQVHELARRARCRGDLPPHPKKGPRVASPQARYASLARQHGMRFGHLGEQLIAAVDEETLRRIAMRASEEGYETLAEYAADLLADQVLND